MSKAPETPNAALPPEVARLRLCEVKDLHGAPAIFVDGKPVPPMTFRIQWYYDLEYIRKYVKTGHKLCLFEVREPWHMDEAQYQAIVDSHLREILALDKGVLLMIGLYVSVSPKWAREHVDELVWYDDGSHNETPEGPSPRFPEWAAASGVGHYSYASLEWKRFGEERVRHWTQAFMAKDYADRIIGVFLQAGKAQEWNHHAAPNSGEGGVDTPQPDYSPAQLRSLRRYLKQKYGTVEKLRAAWNDPQVTFETAQIPTRQERHHVDAGYFRDPARSKKVSDYYECHDKDVAQRQNDFARVVKEETKGRWITGVFHEPTQDGNAMAYDWRSVIDSDVLDFAAGPMAYEQRSPGDHSPLHHVVTSLHAHGKMFFSEDDLRPWGDENAKAYMGRTPSLWHSVEVFKKEIGQNFTQGVQGWWFDFSFKWFHDPAWWRLFKRFNELFELSMRVERDTDSDQLILMDQHSYFYTWWNNRLYRNLVHRQMIQEMGRLGATGDQMMHDDIGLPGTLDKKLYIFLNAFHLTDAERRRIEQLKGGGRTLLFFYAQGLVNSDRKPGVSADYVSELTGIKMRAMSDDVVAYATMMPGEHPIQTPFVSGLTFGQHLRRVNIDTVPPGVEISPVIVPADKDAQTLAWYRWKHDPEPAMAVKDFGDWRSVYIGTIEIPACLLRSVARWAGCHLYLDTDDVVYSSRRWLIVHNCTGPAPKTIRLKRPSAVYNAWTGKRISGKTREFTVKLKPYETGMYFLGDSMKVRKL